MKRALIALPAAALVLAPMAHADGDPHIPNPSTGQCAGGGGGSMYMGYCDGLHYPDETYWHRLAWGMPWLGQDPNQVPNPWTSCVKDTGGPVPDPAPGGCGGRG